MGLLYLGPSISIGYDRPSPDVGRGLFLRVWTPDRGLGPRFNATSCVACHARPEPGGGAGDVMAFVLLDPGSPDPAGGRVLRRFGLAGFEHFGARDVPPTAGLARRRAPPLHGTGLLELVAADEIARWADPDDADGDGISGRVASGRFGWKARFSTLTDAVAAAFAVELGIGSTRFPDHEASPRHQGGIEITNERLEDVRTYLQSLPPLRRTQTNAEALRTGRAVFDRVGCSRCHRPEFPVAQGPGRPSLGRVAAYSDLLLHDLGPELTDGIAEGVASVREFRTAPLWGVSRTGPPYLHDGRAPTLEAAIRAHGDEASGSAQRYGRLSRAERRALAVFLESL